MPSVGKPGRGIVISIDSRRIDSRASDSRSSSQGEAAHDATSVKPVTQVRLAQGLQLHLEEMRIAQALRDFRLQLERELAAGCPLESGDLLYDLQLKIVRRNITNAIVSG